MKMNQIIALAALGAASGLFASSSVAEMETTTQSFSVKLGATRVIYDPESNGATLTVDNTQDYPMLLQSVVLDESRQNKAPFVVTPPLMRLDAQQQSRLRIIRTGGDFANDRETLQWFCAKGIPPKPDDAWANDKKNSSSGIRDKVSVGVQLSINSCIKLLVRPPLVKGRPDHAAANISWTQQGNKVVANNNSPFYMNLISLKVGNVDIIEPRYVPPFSSHVYTIPRNINGKSVCWKIVNDYGGESRLYHGEMK